MWTFLQGEIAVGKIYPISTLSVTWLLTSNQILIAGFLHSAHWGDVIVNGYKQNKYSRGSCLAQW